MTIKLLLIAFVGVGIVLPCRSQDSHTSIEEIAALPTKFIGKVNHRISSLESDLESQTERLLARIKKREARLRKKLQKNKYKSVL